MEREASHCRNCGAVVRGEFCADCGQREGIADQRFLEVARDLASDFIEFDSRFWRTLFPLVLRPGVLSAEYFDGRRARYLPPLRLYLVLSFCLFLYFSFAASTGLVPTTATDDNPAGLSVVVPEQEAPDPNEFDIELGFSGEDSPQWLQTLEQRLEANAMRLRSDPQPLFDSMLDYGPQLMFFLLPLFALLVQCAYLFSPYHYLQHLVFALHYHSFAYLLYLLDVVLEKLWSGFGTLLICWLVAYLPLSLHRAYQSSWGGALGKSLFIYISYGVLMLMGSIGVLILAIFSL